MLRHGADRPTDRSREQSSAILSIGAVHGHGGSRSQYKDLQQNQLRITSVSRIEVGRGMWEALDEFERWTGQGIKELKSSADL